LYVYNNDVHYDNEDNVMMTTTIMAMMIMPIRMMILIMILLEGAF